MVSVIELKLLDARAALYRNALAHAIFVPRDLNTGWLAALGVNEHDIGCMHRHRLVYNLARLGLCGRATVLLDHIDVVEDDHVFLGQYADDRRGSTLGLAGNHHYFVSFFKFHIVLCLVFPGSWKLTARSFYTISGAMVPILLKPRSASSRGIGPKIRVAFGSFGSLPLPTISTTAFSSKRT